MFIEHTPQGQRGAGRGATSTPLGRAPGPEWEHWPDCRKRRRRTLKGNYEGNLRTKPSAWLDWVGKVKSLSEKVKKWNPPILVPFTLTKSNFFYQVWRNNLIPTFLLSKVENICFFAVTSNLHHKFWPYLVDANIFFFKMSDHRRTLTGWSQIFSVVDSRQV